MRKKYPRKMYQSSTVAATVSDVLGPQATNLDELMARVQHTGRLQVLRDLIGDEQLRVFSADAILAAVDRFGRLYPTAVAEVYELASLVAATDTPISLFGRESTFGHMIRAARKNIKHM
jgi:hypothetical protein